MGDSKLMLADLGGLAKPITKLIEAVRAATGMAYAPTHERRMAKAKADANVILAKNQAEVRGIEIRASERLRESELRRQENIEAITALAEAALPAIVSEEPVDDDWIHQFFVHCQDIGNPEMQRIWASLLAGEVAHPGSYSLRTIGLVKVLRKDDAIMFNRLCQFVWQCEDVPLAVVDVERLPKHEIYRNAGLHFGHLLHLDSLGLISATGQNLSWTPDGLKAELVYFGRRFSWELQREIGTEPLEIGTVSLTTIGVELSKVASAQSNDAYRDWQLGRWRGAGHKITEIASK